MTMSRKLSFASVNMRRRNAAMHVLLNTNSEDDVLFVQEPWFHPVGTARADAEINGKDELGGAAHPKWVLAYPYFSSIQRAKVMTYVRIHDRDHEFRKNHCRHIARNDLVSHPCILITDIIAGSRYWRVINFYNDTDDPTALTELLGLDLDSTIPTMIVGDFNLHSPTWSPTGWAKSRHADRVEEWLATQTFSLLSAPGVPTHRGENGARNSTIDLIWANYASEVQGTFFGAAVDWEGSVGSDHALLRTIVTSPHKLYHQRGERTNRFDTDIDEEAWEEWSKIITASLPPRVPLNSSEDIDKMVDAVYDAFNAACSATMKMVGAAPGFASKWWNDDCKEAADALRGAENENDRAALNKALKRVVQHAKRDWANRYITAANVWEVAAWRHGRRSSHIPALLTSGGKLTFDHDEMSTILASHFFAKDPGTIPLVFHDDPPPQPTRAFPPFTERELGDLLTGASNKSAPGSSGIGWALLKRGWPSVKDFLIDIFDACIQLGHHPQRWKEAVVVVIPKPDKPDYSHAKAHRPISLLETMSKLLEKAVAKRFQHDIVKHELIPTNQFGGRAHSSCLDAGLTLLHDVQRAHSIGLKVGILLFDVRGFFDHVNHGRMSSILENLGFAPELVQWSRAFLHNRKVKLRFNSILSEDRDQPVGVPQGSPLSPVLSITYMSFLLRKMEGWTNSSLGMYVDDGILFACAEEWEEVERLLRARYTICEEWLRRSGLAIEPDKTELMFFQKPYERNSVSAPTCLILPDPDTSTYHVVQPVENLRYLGFFINRRLKWEPHVRIMCNRARASIKALRVLGNTIRGLAMANWRLVLNAVCLPVMTYGSQLWFRSDGTRSGWGPKGLVTMLQRVQDEMVKTVMGAFRTAPREALLHFARMLPMRHFLEKLAYTSALRLYRLPRASQLLCRLGPDWYVPGQGDFRQVVPRPSHAVLGRRNQPPTALEALAARVPSEGPRVDVTAVAPWEVPNWEAHTSYMGVTTPHLRKAWVRELTNTSLGSSRLIIHSAAVLTPREFGTEGLLVGRAAATFSLGGSPG